MTEIITELQSFAPEWGIVLGSGLGAVVDYLQVLGSLPFSEVAEIPQSTVPGHAGRFLWGMYAGKRVLIAQGRVHLYEGHSARDVTAGIRWMASCGVRRLILTNAAGTLNEAHPPGSWMLLSDHINLTGTTPLLGGPNFVDMSEVYSSELRGQFAAGARNAGVPLSEGVYAGLLGPQYETPAEIRMLRVLGADAVGMSTVLEAIQARALRMQVAGFSCLTNWAAGINPAPLDHSEVLTTGSAAAEPFQRVLENTLRS